MNEYANLTATVKAAARAGRVDEVARLSVVARRRADDDTLRRAGLDLDIERLVAELHAEVAVIEQSPALLETAYHEAGHAVVALALGMSVESVSVLADSDSTGRVVLDTDVAECLGDRCVVHAAGPLAASRHRGAPGSTVPGDARDLEWIDELAVLCTLGPNEVDAWKAWVVARCAVVLDDYWAAVEVVVTELLALRTLDGDRVRSLVVRSPMRRIAK